MPDTAAVASLTLSPPYEHVAGFRWRARLPEGFGGESDTTGLATASRLQMHENGAPMSAHASHQMLQEEGGGRFSHWFGDLTFSSTDGTDPNANGRRYVVSLGPKVPLIMTFGSCHVHDPIEMLGKRNLAVPIHIPYSQTHYTSETIQLVNIFRGIIDKPVDILNYIVHDSGHMPIRDSNLLDRADITFVEICSPFQIKYGEHFLNRGRVWENIVKPFEDNGATDVADATNRWFFYGILKESVGPGLQETIDEAVPLMPTDTAQQRLNRDIVLNARRHEQTREELAEEIAILRSLIKGPMVIHSHSLRYMPDGRAISWPAKFRRQLNEICQEQGIPIINPNEMVEKYGPEFSLMPDLAYYTPQFKEKLGDAMLAMTERLIGLPR